MAETERVSTIPAVGSAGQMDAGAPPPAAPAATKTDELIDHWIIQNPHRPGPEDVRVRGYGTPVWALIGHAHAIGCRLTADAAKAVAADYDMPDEAVTAAFAYYLRHRQSLDARLAANVANGV